MDEITKAVYRQAIKRYEMYLAGKPVNVIDPDGSTPSKNRIERRVKELKQTIANY